MKTQQQPTKHDSAPVPPRGGKGYYAKRIRTEDNTAARDLGFPDKTGEVKYTKRFPTYAAAKREADAWASTGSWSVSIHRNSPDEAAD